MKITYFAILVALLFAQTASAVPLLEKITIPGNMLTENAVAKSCVIHRGGKMVSRRSLAQLSSTRTTALRLNFAAIKPVIDSVALGTITTGIAPVDGGRVEYHAYQPQADGSLKKIIVWENGEGSTSTNESMEAKLLRNFIDLTCGEPLLY